MPKLIIFDKDGTLTEPISGGAFVQHPHDQRLRPGVAEKLEQLRSDGVMMAIASNQGGCAVFQVPVRDLKVGMLLHDGEIVRKVRSIYGTLDQPRLVTLSDGDSLSFLADEGVDVSYKSIDDAYSEMEFAMKLIAPYLDYATMNQFRGIFCPDMDGKTAHTIKALSPQGEYRRSISLESGPPINYRKPAPGMLIDAVEWLRRSNIEVTELLMVGDRTEDGGAAISAGFAFEWAKDYFGGDNA